MVLSANIGIIETETVFDKDRRQRHPTNEFERDSSADFFDRQVLRSIPLTVSRRPLRPSVRQIDSQSVSQSIGLSVCQSVARSVVRSFILTNKSPARDLVWLLEFLTEVDKCSSSNRG